MSSVSCTVRAYKDYLRVKNPVTLALYENREKADSESTLSEAVIFSMLRSNGYEPQLQEDPSTGGVDFLCGSTSNQFLVEVTNIGSAAVSNISGLPNEITEEVTWFSFGTHQLRTRASKKAGQLAGSKIPRVLAITTQHVAGGVVFGTLAAEQLLTGEPSLSVPVGDNSGEISQVTDLKDSVFFRVGKSGELELCRESISAILLVSIWENECLLLGVLHPQPKVEFPIGIFSKVPFVRVSHWPPREGVIHTQWVISQPTPGRLSYEPFTLRDSELRAGS